MGVERMQIGEVAERVGLSLRTIRFYEEAGLVTPSARSTGGFRLYSKEDLERLQLIKQMKPLDFSVEEIGKLLSTLDALRDETVGGEARTTLLDHLALYRQLVEQRVEKLLDQVASSRDFAARLQTELSEHGSAKRR